MDAIEDLDAGSYGEIRPLLFLGVQGGECRFDICA
jgi:hypothetical protein